MMKTRVRADAPSESTPALLVTVEKGESPSKSYRFTAPFTLGRDKDCDIWLNESVVSRTHVEVKFEEGRWWIHDLKSSNGTYKDGRKVDRAPVSRRSEIRLGGDGPALVFQVEDAQGADTTIHGTTESVTQYVEHYFGSKPPEHAGQHTMLLRRAFAVVAKRQSKKYVLTIAVIAFLFICVTLYAFYTHSQVEEQKGIAAEIFYELKELELAHGRLMSQFSVPADARVQEENAAYVRKRTDLFSRYESFVEDLSAYEGMSEQEKAIYKVIGSFGECEVNIPGDFLDDVKECIKEWKLSPRLRKALQRAKENAYGLKIAEAMLREQMPPHFFFLALQESDFDSNTVGPMTKYGIAKGMWQFIPSTATQYGLRTGPLVSMPRPDPLDERQDVEKSTAAAARYLRDIYRTEAQASGLLVCASYNWGQNLVSGLIRKMPPNPRERNFWRFYETYQKTMPKQTYDYVLHIVSAAAICENPEAFGFEFERPFPDIPPGLGG